MAEPEVIYAHAREFTSGLAHFYIGLHAMENSSNVNNLEKNDRYHDGVN